ncbi:MAG: hypothetical protein ACRDA3_04480 [Peptostreptococcaceae bacterium]
MKDFLEQINNDIKRCENVLKENNYLEIVIAVEELCDKYKEKIDNINLNNGRVWNYTKKDLEDIKVKLVKYKNENIIEFSFKNTLNKFKENKEITEKKLEEIKYILIDIESIYNSKEGIEVKWNNLKKYINYACNENVFVGTNIIDLINIILKIERE